MLERAFADYLGRLDEFLQPLRHHESVIDHAEEKRDRRKDICDPDRPDGIALDGRIQPVDRNIHFDGSQHMPLGHVVALLTAGSRDERKD